MTADLDTLLTALYVKVDDKIRAMARPEPGRPPKVTDSETICLAVAQALLGFTSERRWLRWARKHVHSLFPYLPGQSGYNKRLRDLLAEIKQAVRDLAVDTDFWFDDVWITDSSPVVCGRSRPTAQRSDVAGWAQLRLLRVPLPLLLWVAPVPRVHPDRHADPVGARQPEDRRTGGAHRDVRPGTRAGRLPAGPDPGRGQGFASKDFDYALFGYGVELLRPSKKNEKARLGEGELKAVRQLIESVNDTLKGQLDLERHGGRTCEGVAVRVGQRILAMAAAIWHNHNCATRRCLSGWRWNTVHYLNIAEAR